MYAVGKVGSLISRSVYTVSGPFHPFGGAVDIVVVQQQDGSFKSSPWYVRFGKFQGVLKTREKVVNISVNGVDAGFHMYLDSNGEAFFLRDADPNGEEGEFVVSPASSGDEQEAPTLRKSKSTSCDSSTMEADAGENKILAGTTTTRRTTILERMFGRKPVKNDAHSMDRVSSLERAEIAAELLDTKWSTNLSRGSKSRISSDQPSKSIAADASSSFQMETTEIALPGHSFDDGKGMESNYNNSDCNSGYPGGGMNILANETTTCVKEEVVEIYTHDTSDFRITSTTDQAGSEYLSNDLATENSIHEPFDTLGGSLRNFEDVAGAEIHTREVLSDGVFDIHSVYTEITDGKSEVVSHLVTSDDTDGGNQNSADTNLPSYLTTDLSAERHEISSMSSAQDVVEDKMVIISSTETVETYAVSSIFPDKVHDAGSILLTDGVHVEEQSVASNGTMEELDCEEHKALSNDEGRVHLVVQDHADSVLEDLQVDTDGVHVEEQSVAPHGTMEHQSSKEHRALSDNEDKVDLVLQDYAVSGLEDLQASPDGVHVEERSMASFGTMEQVVSEEPRALSDNVDKVNLVVQDHADSVLKDLQTSPIGVHVEEQSIAFPGTMEQLVSEEHRALSDNEDKVNVVVQDYADSGLKDLQASPDGAHVEEESIASLGTMEHLISEEHRALSDNEEKGNVVVQDHADSVLEDLQASGQHIECSVGTVMDFHSTNSPHDLTFKNEVFCHDASSDIVEIVCTENAQEGVTKDSSVENKAYSGDLNVPVTPASPTGEGSKQCFVKFVNSPNNVEREDLPVVADEREAQDTKTDNDDANRPLSMSGDEIWLMQEKTEETEAVVSFSENIEEIQFQFSDTESFADTKVVDEIRANKKTDGRYDESDCDAEELHEGHNDSANDSENCSIPLIPETGPLPVPGCDVHSGDNDIGVKSLPNLRSSIHDLERSDSVQLSRSLGSEHENNGVEPVKSMNSPKQEPEATDDPEENSKMSEVTSNSLPEDKDADNLKVDSFNPVAELSLCRHLLSEGMGEDAAGRAFDSEKVSLEKFRTMKQSLIRNNKLVVRIAGRYFPWDAAAPIVLGMVSFSEEQVFEPQGMIKVERVETSLASGGSWRIWPFSFRRARAISTVEPVCESIVETPLSTPVKEADIERSKSRTKRMDRKVRSLTPTSDELASLDLREGRNEITFTFSTAMLGKQQVDCRIYLWKWNTRIVISDVDGTITKSDVLGQFMPLVGVDWSQNGVAHLFSAIKENGYQLLFLSARSISQAHLTRQFLFNLKQDGKALPDGPVVISPDGLFPSLYREVIRRAPHEFKISCLEAIRSLFPPDSNPNPFYAGFGNRDTDELSYLKVGIPMGKIFIINPKGEVAVNRRVDTKSYTSLHALVHGMFPPITTTPEQEDYNTWNYWKMPLPDVDI